jgi:hypothetical protein
VFLPKTDPYPFQAQRLLPKLRFLHRTAGETTKKDDTQMARRATPRKLGLSRRREIDPETVGTNLYVADRRLLDDEVGKKGTTRSELIRQIVHQWAIKKRLAPDAADNTQEPTLVALQKKTVTELGEARKEIQTLLAQLKEATATQTDLLSLNETEFKRVLALDSAHYNLSAQSFTAVWAVLDFLQRFMVDPILANNPHHKPDPHAESVRQRRDARVEGLQMAERMDEQFQSPQPIQMVLISPPGEG